MRCDRICDEEEVGMPFLRRLFGSPARPEKTDDIKVVEIRDWTYPVTPDIRKLAEVIAETGAGALLMNTLDLRKLERRARREFVRKFGKHSIYTRTFWTDSPVVCAGCQRQIPPSLCMALTEPGWAGSGMVIATGSTSPARDRFAKTGRCPRCGSSQSYIVVDVVPGDTITQDDVHVIKDYARHLAEGPWGPEGKAEIPCHECGNRIPQGKRLMIGFTMYCESCYDHKYGNMLEALRRKPNILEVSLVRKARAFAQQARRAGEQAGLETIGSM
jgi:hypothetical protein